MTDETGAPAGGETIAVVAPADTGTDISVSQAARALAAARHKPKEPAPVEQPNPSKDAADPVEQPELAQRDRNSDPASSDPATDPAEVTTEVEPAEKPPIDPPRSWTQAEKERFQSLPRETQEYLHTREQEREREFRRGQNEIAEQRKAFAAEQEATKKLRQEYEAKLPALMQQIHQQGPFADIKSQDDADKLAAEDPFRYLQWDAYQKRLAGMAYEAREVEARQSQERNTQWAQSVQKENELAAEHIPELADKVKGPALVNRVATELLPDLGFKDSELADLASGKQRLSIYDHRIQRLLADSLKLRDIQKAKVAAAPKELPPVQRPGTAKPSGNSASEHIKTLTDRLNQTGDIKDAIALRTAQQNAARRRAS